MAIRDVEEFTAWQNKKNSWIQNVLKTITPIQLIALALVISIGLLTMSSGKANNNLIFGGIGLAILIILLKSKKSEEKEPIPENIIKFIGKHLMDRKIGSELPWGTIINSTPFCAMRYEGEWGAPFRPWKWEVGFIVIYPNLRKEIWLVRFHPYDGYITKIEKKPAGYIGDESTDLKILLPTQMAIKEEKPKSE